MILDKIVERKKERIETEKKLDIDKILKAKNQSKKNRFYDAIAKKGLSIIGEIKKASPSKGIIKEDFNPVKIAKEYESAVDAVSVLTEEDYFLGHIDYLKKVKNTIQLPVLMKDFIIDPVQIYRAKETGADCILLIAAILDSYRLKEYINLSESLGLDALVEAHTQEEIEKALNSGAEIIGINNRNLEDFTVSLNTTVKLRKYIPEDKLVISESGISTIEDIRILRQSDINGILVGETFMRTENIKKKAQEFKKAYG